MFDLNSITNIDCLICRDKLIDISDREVNKKFTKKEYKVYLKPLTKLDCEHYYHINCIKTAIVSSTVPSTYNHLIFKKCPYCSCKINKITPLFNELVNKDMLFDKKEVVIKKSIKNIKNTDNKKARCICTTASGKKCKLFESSIGSKYCRIHKYHMDKSNIPEMNTTSTSTNEMDTSTNEMDTSMNENGYIY
jgi:hypothetical protein